ncbi:hypothetical protein GCM10022247_34010 [Allokutzneria multivorans]|uniref:Secreted protein n=1 Tax=Allokutzneria multivorans TaxID=1142134 RepID=A0ABP7SAF1_9PSEU
MLTRNTHRIASLVACTIAFSLTPGVAQAATRVDTTCGQYICVHTLHEGRNVKDITVEVRKAGDRFKLGAFFAEWRGEKSPMTNRARWDVNLYRPNNHLVCGYAQNSRSVQQGGNVCVTI